MDAFNNIVRKLLFTLLHINVGFICLKMIRTTLGLWHGIPWKFACGHWSSSIFPARFLPIMDQIYAISEIIILKNYQHQQQYQQTTGYIQRLINNTHLLLIGLILAEEFFFRKCVCSSQGSLACTLYNNF